MADFARIEVRFRIRPYFVRPFMTPSRIARTLALVLLLSPVLYAAAASYAPEDITGKWAGTFIVNHDGQTEDSTVHMVVAKQTGADLTGTIGENAENQWPIEKGKIETAKVEGKDVTKITFDVHVGGSPDGPLAHFVLALANGHIKGDAKAEKDGQSMSAVIDMQRLK
jgi:hypothetical protein